ncbi:MAG: SPFH domain-containing protein [Bradymonadia bacterium]
MAEISKLFGFRHLRSEPSCHVLRYGKGRLKASGRGLAFWFWPMSSSIAEIPMDDRDVHLLFHGRSKDFQDATVQGVCVWRVADPERVGGRIDFSLDLERGVYTKTPIEQVDALLTGMAQQLALRHVANLSVRALLAEGVEVLQSRIAEGLIGHPTLTEMGIEVVEVRMADVRPTMELDKALQTPTREAIQQDADEATFQRRALAVEKERAIAENELQNRIELARREEQLIEQRGQNDRRRAEEEAQAEQIKVDAQAARTRVEAEARADQIRQVEHARVEAEQTRMDIYKELPTSVMMGLAARELAGKLKSIDHLNLAPDALGPMLTRLMEAGTQRLEAPAERPRGGR